MTAHTPAEWAGFLSLGVSGIGFIAFALAFAGAERIGLDPRRLLETDAGGRLLVEIVRAKTTARLLLRDAAVTVAALLMLLTPAAAPEGTS